MFPAWEPRVIEVPITVTLDAYTAGDAVGGLLTSDSIPQIKGGGYIAWVRLYDAAAQSEPFKLWCFYDAPTTIANDAAFTMVAADWAFWFTTIDIAAADYDATGDDVCAMVCGKDTLSDDYHMFPYLADGVMYFYLVPSATPDYAAATDLTMHICFMLE